MRCLRQVARLLLIVQVLLQATCESLIESEIQSQTNQVSGGEELVEEPAREESSRKEEQGSWSQWWSYYGISGPNYWSINKPWQVCGWGRKQSPVEVRTSRLLYDHTLGPFRLTWLPVGAQTDESNAEQANQQQQQQQTEQQQQQQAAGQNQANQNQLNPDDIIKQQQQQRSPVRLRLLNSGRGIEAWLEEQQQRLKSDQRTTLKEEQTEEELILSHGPLSYAYKLFKIELHSSASYSLAGRATPASTFKEEGEESVPEALASGKSSEHLIDGHAFDGELQLHFYNKRLASSAAHALKLAEEQAQNSLFAVISVLLVAKNFDDDGDLRRSNQSSALDFLLDNLSAIPDQGNSVELRLARRHIEALVPERNQYITYEGSLNRPPCSESVDWILVNRALRVRAEKFRALFDKLNTNQENVRPIKPLFRRTMRTTISGLRAAGQPRVAASAELEPCANEQSTTATAPASVARVKNCTTARQQLDFVANRSNAHLDSHSHKQPWTHEQHNEANSIQCSMKPHYVYQLTYSE